MADGEGKEKERWKMKETRRWVESRERAGIFKQSPNFKTFKEPKNRFQGTNSVRLCSLAGRYDNSIPTRFLAPTDCLKIPAESRGARNRVGIELSYRPAQLHRLAGFIPWNRFLGSINV